MRKKRLQRMDRRTALGLFALTVPLTSGCAAPWFRGSSPEEVARKRRESLRQELEVKPRLLSEIAQPQQLTMQAVENVGLVTRLVGRGGAVRPSQPRRRMIDQMDRNDVKNPNSVLDAEDTAMIIAAVAVPPAVRKGDTLDVLVNCSQHCEATDLANGWLLPTPLKTMSKLGGTLRQGFKSASGTGQIVTVAQVSGSDDPADKLRGSIIGGAQYLKQRDLGLAIIPEFADAITLAKALPDVNKRFTVFDGREHVGVATPVQDDYVKIALPNRYRLDPYHFIHVVLNVAFPQKSESPEDRAIRLEMLSGELHDPARAQQVCWQLEAIGAEAIPVLQQGLASADPKVRFFSAHSLAYLDDKTAIEPLAQLCVAQPAFRAMALNALATTDHFTAAKALRSLLHSADAESRYGAVRALRERDSRDPIVSAQPVGDTGFILEIPSESPPLIAISLSRVPEIVMFGCNPVLNIPDFVYVNQHMIIKRQADGSCVVSNFVPGMEDRVATAKPELRSLLEAISEVGGAYGDWVSFIRQSSTDALFAEPVAYNPVPVAGRTYEQKDESAVSSDDAMLGEEIVTEVTSAAEPDEGDSEESWLSLPDWF